MLKSIIAASVAAFSITGAAYATTLSGTFDVLVVNVTGVNAAESSATIDALTAAGFDDSATSDVFTYTGALDFGTFDPNDGTTVSGFLATGGGVVSGLDAIFDDLQLSAPSIGAGTATTTFFFFASPDIGAGDFDIRHDDGISLFEDGAVIGSSAAPTTVIETEIDGFGGGFFNLLYVATNGDPSVLEVDFTPAPVPLPASMPLLAVGFGGLLWMRRRKTA